MTRKPRSGGKARGRQKGKEKDRPKAKGPGKARARQKGVGKRPESATTEHWLRRPETIRRLWIGGLFALAGLVVVEVWVYTHGYFGIDGLFAFNAWFGFLSCIAMIVISNGMGKLLKREDTYYDLD